MIMRLKSFARRFPEERLFSEWGQGIIAKVEDCEDCGKCEERCPYELSIRETMKKVVEWYNEEMAKGRELRA